MENALISHLRIDNVKVRSAVRELLNDILVNVLSIDFSCFRGDIVASAFYNPVDREEFTTIATKLKTFVDDHVSFLHFAMGMPTTSTRPVESMPGFDWDAIFYTIRGLQTGTDQSYSMAMLSSTILSQAGKRDFIKSPRRDTVESDLKHAVGAVLVLQTLQLALQAPMPAEDIPVNYYHVFVDRTIRRFHEAATATGGIPAPSASYTTPTFTAPATGAEVMTAFDFATFGHPVKAYDNPPALRPFVEQIVHRVLFAAAQVLLTDRRFIPDPVQFHKWTQFVVQPSYVARLHPLAAKAVAVASSAFLPPVVVASATFVVAKTPSSAAAHAHAKKPDTLPKLATASSPTSGTGMGAVTWNASVRDRPATATPSPRPRSITPSKVALSAAAVAENF